MLYCWSTFWKKPLEVQKKKPPVLNTRLINKKIRTVIKLRHLQVLHLAVAKVAVATLKTYALNYLKHNWRTAKRWKKTKETQETKKFQLVQHFLLSLNLPCLKQKGEHDRYQHSCLDVWCKNVLDHNRKEWMKKINPNGMH